MDARSPRTVEWRRFDPDQEAFRMAPSLPPTQRVAVTGTDGTGKTTIVRRLAERFADRPGLVRAFRAPQYHEDPDLPFAALSKAIDDLSVLADMAGDPILKATALFLSMTLYGDVERFVAGAYRPRHVVAERQCLADSLTYARFYLPLLKGPLDRERLEARLVQTLGADAFARVEAWVGVFQAREPGRDPVSVWELPLFIRDLFSSPPEVLLPRLQTLYHAEIPDRIVLLTLTPEALAERMALKKGQAPTELHEQAHILAMFQQGLTASCQALASARPGTVVVPIDASTQTPSETEAAVLAAIGLVDDQAL
jgi:broad-specificity NMP kinase